MGQPRLEIVGGHPAGVADGGAYNGWNQSCPQGGCTLGWHNNYQVVTGSGPNPDLINFGIVGGGAQGSALLNLASFKNSPNMVLNFLEWHNGAYNVVNNEFTTNPFVHYFGGPITLAFVTGDGTPRDNFRTVGNGRACRIAGRRTVPPGPIRMWGRSAHKPASVRGRK